MAAVAPDPQLGRVVGRYVLYDQIASGGMATIHLGRLQGQVGFARVVAIKRLHPHLAQDPEFVAMLLDEARLAAGISHPNVVPTVDVVADDGEIFLVMEYVEGDSLSHLIRFTRKAGKMVDPAHVSTIITGALYGLHAAHTAVDDKGQSLNIVHRDFSPQNILVGTDGVPRVLDFGVARAARRIAATEAGRTKGKFSYMAPEQVRMDSLDHRADIFSAGICAWEALTGRYLFQSDDPGRTIAKVLEASVPPPSSVATGIPAEVDAILLKALARNPDDRWSTAREMAIALEEALRPALPRKVGEWVQSHVGDEMRQRSQRLAELAAAASGSSPQNVEQLRAELASGRASSADLGRAPVGTQSTSVPSAWSVAAEPSAPAASAPSASAPAPTASSPVASRPRPPSVNDDDEPTKLSDPALQGRPALPRSDYDDESVATRVQDSGGSLPAGGPGAPEPPAVPEVSVSPDLSAAPDAPGASGAPFAPYGVTPHPAHVGIPISNISEVSVGSYAGPPRRSLPPKKSLIAVAAVLGVAMLIGLIALAVGLSRSGEDAADVANAPTGTATAAAVAPPAAPTLEAPAQPEPSASVAETKATAEPAPEPEEAAPEPKAETKPAKPEPAAEKKPATVSSPKPAVTAWKPAVNCNPPYTMENGIKKFKKECL